MDAAKQGVADYPDKLPVGQVFRLVESAIQEVDTIGSLKKLMHDNPSADPAVLVYASEIAASSLRNLRNELQALQNRNVAQYQKHYGLAPKGTAEMIMTDNYAEDKAKKPEFKR